MILNPLFYIMTLKIVVAKNYILHLNFELYIIKHTNLNIKSKVSQSKQ